MGQQEAAPGLDPARVMEILARTPDVLQSMLAGLSESVVQAAEDDDAWSPYDVVGHLIHGEKTDWIPRLRLILDEGEERPFEPFDRFAQFEASRGRSLESLLDEFAGLRALNLKELRRLEAEGIDLETTGTHPDLGRVTAGELLATWAVHDLGHLVQIGRTMARGLGTAVGPWKSYLSILGA